MQDKRNIESVVKEIMGLVDSYAYVKMNQQTFTNFAAKSISEKIESKLRELAENSFSVQEPLSDDMIIEIKKATSANGDFSPFSETKAFARAIERANNITKDS